MDLIVVIVACILIPAAIVGIAYLFIRTFDDDFED